MLSASNLSEKNLLFVVSFLIICCTLHKLVVKKKKIISKRNQMTICWPVHHFVHCHSQKNFNIYWNNTRMTMANLLVTMRGKETLKKTWLFSRFTDDQTVVVVNFICNYKHWLLFRFCSSVEISHWLILCLNFILSAELYTGWLHYVFGNRNICYQRFILFIPSNKLKTLLKITVTFPYWQSHRGLQSLWVPIIFDVVYFDRFANHGQQF